MFINFDHSGGIGMAKKGCIVTVATHKDSDNCIVNGNNLSVI